MSAPDIAAIWHGAALVGAGRTAEGLDMMRAAVGRYTATAARLASLMLMTYAWACSRCGEVAEGLATVERAFDLGCSTFDHMFEAELWRLKGEMLLTRAPGDARVKSRRSMRQEAEGCFDRARDLLGPIVDRFVEDLDTPDLGAARHVLRDGGQ